ncbi:hypothetical protein LWI28_007484 [Acer negundo]|uniref:Uncharacterized protein n=1 Tax=Acer negundo TaxID=4023 RepID=A0AAD5JCG9_ACENE|nr:hypothetical protein LWI28_007484 [Acer negundo]
MGTSTIIGVSYKGGVVLGTSTGMYVSNGTASDKITKLTDNVLLPLVLYGFFDLVWKQGITKQEAQQLVVKALSLANTARVVRTFTINSEGVTTNFYPGQDLDAHTSLLDLLNAPLAPDQRN